MEENKKPDYLNENYSKKNKSDFSDITVLAEEIKKGNRVALSKGITLVESEKEEHRTLANQLLTLLLPFSGKSIRIGITGVPGAGKSTFIETFGTYLTKENKKLAVLAIDPSSTTHKGSILGDKTRMEELSIDKNAFIRPSPSGGALGGVARKTRETIFLCEAAGFDTILVETVGVGQSETDVHSMVDVFLLLLITGAGDELQGIKRGIMEMADILIVNKDDGDNKKNVIRAKQQTISSLHLFPPAENNWIPPVLSCSSIEKTGIDEIWKSILSFENSMKISGHFAKKRSEQSLYWLHQTIVEELKHRFYHRPDLQILIKELESKVLEGKMNSFEAAFKLLDSYEK